MATLPAQSRLLVSDGNVDKALAGAAKVVEATYYYPYQLHGSMGPSCAVADVKADEATVWSPTQGVYPLRTAVAKVLGFKDQQVHVIYKEGSGCYGLNGADTASIDAVLMSKAVGAPVRVQWMRADEHIWEHYGTPMVMRVKGGLDADGNLIAWDYESLQASRGGRPGNVGAANLPTGALIGLTLPATRASAPTFPPLGADNSNTVAGYLLEEEGLVPNARVIAKTVDSPYFTGPLRSPARIQNSFANESFIDELAAAAGADPVTFRLRYVGDERLRHVIEVAAKAAGWELRNSPKPASKGDIATGRGFAAMQYEGEDGYAGIVCEIEVNKKTGKIRVTRVVVSHDVGIIINPRGIKAQIQGNVVHGVSRALKEEVALDPKAKSTDWDSYQVLRFTELPEVKIALISRPNKAPTGSGENAMTAIPAAVANALFDATGVRVRRLPLTPARVKAALAELEREGRPPRAAAPRISPGEAALGDGLLDEAAGEGEERPVVRRVRRHRLGEDPVDRSRRERQLDLDFLGDDCEEAPHRQPRIVAVDRHPPGQPGRGLADDVDPLGARRREGRHVAIALVLQQVDVDRERRRRRRGRGQDRAPRAPPRSGPRAAARPRQRALDRLVPRQIGECEPVRDSLRESLVCLSPARGALRPPPRSASRPASRRAPAPRARRRRLRAASAARPAAPRPRSRRRAPACGSR